MFPKFPFPSAEDSYQPELNLLHRFIDIPFDIEDIMENITKYSMVHIDGPYTTRSGDRVLVIEKKGRDQIVVHFGIFSGLREGHSIDQLSSEYHWVISPMDEHKGKTTYIRESAIEDCLLFRATDYNPDSKIFNS